MDDQIESLFMQENLELAIEIAHIADSTDSQGAEGRSAPVPCK